MGYFAHKNINNYYNKSQITYYNNLKKLKERFLSMQKKKVVIKIKNPKSEALGRMENEANYLKILNKKGIGPKFIRYDKNVGCLNQTCADELRPFPAAFNHKSLSILIHIYEIVSLFNQFLRA